MAGETLTKDEVCRRLGVSGKVLDGMIRRREWPVGFKPSAKSRPVWSLDVFAAALLVLPLLTGRVDDAPDSDSGEES